jgi:hypothetical protein
MALLKYFKRSVTSVDSNLPNPFSPPIKSSLTKIDIEKVNSKVKDVIDCPAAKRGKYENYTSEERATIGKHATLHGATKASRHFSKTWGRSVPESTARRLKKEYTQKLKEIITASSCSEEPVTMEITTLPKKVQGRPLLLGKELDLLVQQYIKALRKTSSVVNTAIVQAVGEGIVQARDPSLLKIHGGYLLVLL